MELQVRVIRGENAVVADVARLPALMADARNLIWVDIPSCDDTAKSLLRDIFGFHPAAVYECATRQRMPKFHPYPDHAFVVLHAPEQGANGHVHYVELDQFIAERYLVTVHGPTNPAVGEGVPLQDTDAVWHRIRCGRFHPGNALELSHAIVANLARGMEDTLEVVTADVWHLEQDVTGGQMGDPEEFLDRMFRTRHGLLAVANMTASALEVYGRMDRVTKWFTPQDRQLIEDNIDQFRRVRRLAEGQRDYLQGVIEFYRTKNDTKMTIAGERLAVIAVVTLPITALASILGMNVIVSPRTHYPFLSLSVGVMCVMSLVLLRWAKKQGWW
jgi:Mg2+ and Co2+ transporter CorA